MRNLASRRVWPPPSALHFASIITAERVTLDAPEPGTMALLAGALVGMGGVTGRRRG